MAILHAPFNFVPLPKQVFFPEWADQVSQDIPFEDGESGIIELEITNITPLFTQNGHKKDVDEVFSSHIELPNGEKQYFIPGTTLKGCFRSIMEILSFAKMGLFNNSSFGMQRIFDGNNSDSKAYKQPLENVTCGWLEKIHDKVFFHECKEGVHTISHEDIKKNFPRFHKGEDHKTAALKQYSIASPSDYYPLYDIDGQTYRIVCTGYMNGKSHEYLFSEELLKAVEIPNVVFLSFETIHSRTEYYYGKDSKDKDCLRYRLNSGELIPVFVTKKEGKVDAIGITRYFRYPYNVDVKKGISAISKEYFDERLDLPEIIFGYSKGRDSMKGRVSFGHAFCQTPILDHQLISISGILGQPSASYYPLYLHQNSSLYNTYQTAGTQIAGRKRYRIIRGYETNLLPQNDKNEKVTTKFKVIPKQQHFTCKIAVYNRRKAEIGALITSLTLNHTEGCYVNIGLAKSYGYGKITTHIKLHNFTYSEEDYCRAFEETLINAGFNIFNNPIWNTLAAIASEHNANDMKMMDLSEYTANKRNINFSKLTESKGIIFRTYTSTKDLEDIKRAEEEKKKIAEEQQEEKKRIRKLFDDVQSSIRIAQQQISTGQTRNALDTLNTSRLIALNNNLATDEIDKLIAECEDMINAKGARSLQEMLLEATNIGRIITLTKQWLRDSGQMFSEREFQVLIDAIRRTESQKALASKQKDLVKVIGQEWTQKLLQQIN